MRILNSVFPKRAIKLSVTELQYWILPNVTDWRDYGALFRALFILLLSDTFVIYLLCTVGLWAGIVDT
jgi:hypothetical protein